MSLTGFNRARREKEEKPTMDDLEMKPGGYYYLDGEYFAHGESNARRKLEELGDN